MFRLKISICDQVLVEIPKHIAHSNPSRDVISFVVYVQLLENANLGLRKKTLLGSKVLKIYHIQYSREAYLCLVKLKKWTLYLRPLSRFVTSLKKIAVYDPISRDYVKLLVRGKTFSYFYKKNWIV